MSQSTSPSYTRPWNTEVLPDFFGYHLWLDGHRFYIPKEKFDSVLVAMALVKEQESSGSELDWIDELRQSVRPAAGE